MAEGSVTIEQATLGYSQAGLNKFLIDIHSQVIDAAKTEISTAGTNLKNEIDGVWRGKSADTFKKNMDHDFKVLTDAMDEAENLLKVELQAIIQEMSNMDQNLMKENA